MAKLEIDLVRIAVSVKKTIQEKQFEPLSIELSCEEVCEKSKRKSATAILYKHLKSQLDMMIHENV